MKKDREIYKTLRGYIAAEDLNALYAEAMPLHKTITAARRKPDSVVYEVRIKIEGKV